MRVTVVHGAAANKNINASLPCANKFKHFEPPTAKIGSGVYTVGNGKNKIAKTADTIETHKVL